VRKTRLFEYGVLDPYTDCGVLSTEGVFRDGRYSNAGLLSTGSEFGAQNWAFCVREARGDGGGPERCAARPSRHPSKPREPALGPPRGGGRDFGGLVCGHLDKLGDRIGRRPE
jgi:hypothetical protein